ncbi:MAG: hypothetical protein WAV54_17285 [Acidimicrobiales bacterium]
MSAAGRGEIDRVALQKLIAASGVAVDAAEVDAVARSLDRIRAAATLLLSSELDETGERFYRLLEIGAANGATGE